MSKTLLVVDDSIILMEIIGLAIENSGYKLLLAGSVNDALKQLDGQKIHLFLVDINMPGMDGFDFVKHVKGHSLYKHTPILMLTSELNPIKKQVAKDAGVSGWVQKPFKVSVLLDAIDKFVDP